MDTQHYRARRYGIAWDMFGRTRRVPEVRSVHKHVIAAGLRQAGNHPIQAPDSAMMRLALAEVQEAIVEPWLEHGVWVWPLMTVHDEGIWEVDEAYGELFLEQALTIFEDVMIDRATGVNQLRVKIKAEGKVMMRWEK